MIKSRPDGGANGNPVDATSVRTGEIPHRNHPENRLLTAAEFQKLADVPANVKYWRDQRMVERSVASAWLLTENRFRKISGHRDLWALATILPTQNRG
jgi:hypothetical protein